MDTLLSLPGLDSCQSLLTAPPVGLLASLSVQAVVPPAEAGGVVANELLVMHVVVLRTRPEGKEVAQAPREVIARVRVDSLEQTENDPHIHGEQVQVTSNRHPQDGTADSTNSQQHNLDRRSILGSKTEGRRVSVMQLVDVLVERAVVQRAVEPVVPSIFHDEESSDLVSHLEQGREGHAVVHAEKDGDRVEEPNLWQLNGDMADKDEGSAIKLLAP